MTPPSSVDAGTGGALRPPAPMPDSTPGQLRAFAHPALWTLLLAAIVSLPLVRAGRRPAEPPLPVLGTVPTFSFVDQGGRPFGPRDLAGRPWVADFIFTRCPTVCPRMTRTLAALRPRLGERIELVSISVDPEFDTPERLRAFAARHGADAPGWHFLTGQSAGVEKAVTEGFRIALARESDDFLGIVHGVHLVLVDGQGRIRGYYDSTDPDAVERLVHDAARLAG